MSLELSPSAKKEVTNSNKSKHSFYSRSQFEHYSEDDNDDVEVDLGEGEERAGDEMQ